MNTIIAKGKIQLNSTSSEYECLYIKNRYGILIISRDLYVISFKNMKDLIKMGIKLNLNCDCNISYNLN